MAKGMFIRSKETRRKIKESNSKNGTLFKKGVDNPNWKGGFDKKEWQRNYDKLRRKKSFYNRGCHPNTLKNLHPSTPEELRIRFSGKQNHNWKNGISKQIDYNKNRLKKWKETEFGKFSIKKYNLYRRMKTEDLTVKTIQIVYEDNIKKQGTLTCYLCLKPIEFKKDHLEHKIPLSRGGTNEYNNLAVACQRCNNKKHIKTEEEFRMGENLWV